MNIYKQFIIYKITRKRDLHYYLGKSTVDHWYKNNYWGRGKIMQLAKKKYGLKIDDYYIREIIQYYNTWEECDQAEIDIIAKHINDPMCMNLRYGGSKGSHSKKTKKLLSMIGKERFKNYNERKKISITTKNAMSRPDVKENIKKSRINKKLSESHKYNIGKGLKQAHKKDPNIGRKIGLKLSKFRRNESNIIIKTPEKEFYTYPDAAKYYKLHRVTIMDRCKSNLSHWKDWFVIPK